MRINSARFCSTAVGVAASLLSLVLWTGAAVAASIDEVKALAERHLDGGARATGPNFDEIMAKGELVIAVYRDFPPFSTSRDGRLEGVDVDLGTALAKHLKLRPSFFPLTAGETVEDDLRNGVWKGHYLERRIADVMLHVPTERAFVLRQTEAVLFAPYFRERVVVARDPDRIYAKDSVEIFAEEKVGVELDSLSDLYLTSALGGRLRANVVHYATHAKAIDGLLAGEVAAVMGAESELAAGLAARESRWPLGPMTAPGLSKTSWELGLAVRDSNRDLAYALGDAIAALRADGTIERIFRRHHLPYHAPEE